MTHILFGGKTKHYPGKMFDYHLKPFQAAIDAGTSAIMPYYAKPIGTQYEPLAFAYNKAIIKDLLRTKMGFKGIINSDTGPIEMMPWGVEKLTILERYQKALDCGVDIFSGSSVPGSGVSALVRGTNSISAATGPFIVVDGIPFSTTGGSLNDINPNDIESMEILKDASAVAIYGTRGANGVILISTKRGKSGKPVIRYNTYIGVEDFAHVVEPMNGTQYAQKYADWKKQANSTDVNAVPNAYEQANLAAGITTNWLEQVRQAGSIQNHNLSVSGGTDDVKYFISGDYLNQGGVIKGYQ